MPTGEKVGIATHNTVESFFFVEAAAHSQLFGELLGKYLLVSELHNAHIIR